MFVLLVRVWQRFLCLNVLKLELILVDLPFSAQVSAFIQHQSCQTCRSLDFFFHCILQDNVVNAQSRSCHCIISTIPSTEKSKILSDDLSFSIDSSISISSIAALTAVTSTWVQVHKSLTNVHNIFSSKLTKLSLAMFKFQEQKCHPKKMVIELRDPSWSNRAWLRCPKVDL